MNQKSAPKSKKSTQPLRDNAAGYRTAVAVAVSAALESMMIPRTGLVYVEQSLKAPSRMTGPARKNLSGRYPSSRMGVTIQFESGTLELPAIHELEHDERAIGYFDQTPKIKLSYKTARGKRTYLVTPDFLVVYAGRTVLVECKPISVLKKRAEADPELFTQVGGVWTCPPAQAAAAEMGFEHEVWTEDHFNPVKLANLQLLEDYFAPLVQDQETAEAAAVGVALAAVEEAVRAVGTITVEALLEVGRGRFTIDHVYSSIAQVSIAADLSCAALHRHETFRVYSDLATLEAYERSNSCITRAGDWTGPATLDLKTGSQVVWDGVLRQVANAGTNEIHFHGDDGGLVSLDRKTVAQLLARKTMQPVEPIEEEDAERKMQAHEFIQQCRSNDLDVANDRFQQIVPILDGIVRAESRSLRRWVQMYRQAEASFGNGYLGLVPKFWSCGNRAPRLLPIVLDIVADKLNDLYLDKRNVNKRRVYEAIVLECEEKAVPAPCYSWLCRFIKAQSKYLVKRAREGDKSAYGLSPRSSEEADAAGSPHPVRPFERAHIDHTQVDVETIFSGSGENLGRPWVTVMIDHYSRRILGFFLTYDSPSYRSVLMVLRDCVRRYGRLPSTIVVDGGKEFRSTWFEVTCAFFKVTVMRRPPRKGRFGSQIERYFGTHNTMLLHTLRGNTQLRKNVRQMTPAVDPSKTAVWTLVDLHELMESFYFTVYDSLTHTGIRATPRDAFARGMLRHGQRPTRTLAYDLNFMIMTCPSTAKGKAKIQPDGVKINYFYYNAQGLSRHIGKSVDVRYEPFDLSVAYAFIDRKWVRIRCRFDGLLQGLGEHELALVTAEYTRLNGLARRQRLNDTSLARFLREVEAKELLLAERKRAMEQHRLLNRINGVPEESLNRRNEEAGSDLHQMVAEATREEPASPEDAHSEASEEMDEVDLIEMEAY